MFHCYSLMIRWRDIDEQGRFRCKQYWSEKKIVLIFQTLMFHCCFLEILLMSLRRIFDETLMFSIQTPMIRNFFRVLISETFMFHYCVSDDSMMILRRGIVETARIWMRKLMIINSSFCLSQKHCRFSSASLMILWKDIDEQWRLRYKH